VVIPTHRRHDELDQVLAALVRQTLPAHEFEVVVVEDEDHATVEPILDRYRDRLDLRLELSGLGKGGTRNLGIQRSRGELVLLLDDDVVPDPTLVSTHRLAHTERYPGREQVVLGKVTLHPGIPRNAFRSWLEQRGPQFAFERLPPHAEIGPEYFYTCNLSLKRALIDGYRFDEELEYYEDFELGFRLQIEQGMTLHYVPEAHGEHLAPDTFVGFFSKRHDAGAWRPRLVRLQPDARNLVERIPGGVRTLAGLLGPAERSLRSLGCRVEHQAPRYAAVWGPVFALSLRASFLRGYREAERLLE